MSDFKIVKLLDPISLTTNIRPTGVYSNSAAYGIGDSVSYGTNSYICITPTTGNIPTNTTYWQLLASASTIKLTTDVYNQTGATLLKGSVVYINGAHGNLPTVTLAQADTEPHSSKSYGIVSANISNNSNGVVVAEGLVENLDTSAYADGDILWLSPTIAGGMIATLPIAPDHAVLIGTVTRSHPTSGTIQLKIQNGFQLNQIHDVYISNIADGDLLTYETSTSLWKNKEDKSIINALIFG